MNDKKGEQADGWSCGYAAVVAVGSWVGRSVTRCRQEKGKEEVLRKKRVKEMLIRPESGLYVG